MIDEQDLFALGDAAHEPVIECRPVEDVLARGRRLRRLRRAVRTVGGTAVVAGLVGTGVLVLGRGPGHTDIEMAREPSTTSTTATEDCSTGTIDTDSGFVAPRHILPSEVPDAMRVLPSWTPGDVEVTHARGERYTLSCSDTIPSPADDALDLEADGGDGTIDAEITLSGPLSSSVVDEEDVYIPGEQPTELRGQPAVYAPGSQDGWPTQFIWTDADGWTWELRGYGAVDEATVRAVGEALVLDSSPADDQAVADLPNEAMPAGFSVAWQTRGAPALMSGETTMWSVRVGRTQAAVQTGIECLLQVDESQGEAGFETRGTAGSQRTTVNGQLAWWRYETTSAAGLASTLRWEVAPGLVATAGCTDWDEGGTLPMETIVRFAESVVPVPSDDPRVPQEIPPQPADDRHRD